MSNPRSQRNHLILLCCDSTSATFYVYDAASSPAGDAILAVLHGLDKKPHEKSNLLHALYDSVTDGVQNPEDAVIIRKHLPDLAFTDLPKWPIRVPIKSEDDVAELNRFTPFLSVIGVFED